MDGNAIILSNGILGQSSAKTANGLIRGTERFKILAVIDHHYAGKDAGKVIDGISRNIPVYETLSDFLLHSKEKADFCIIGIATRGGKLPEDMKPVVNQAMEAGLNIINGLHEFLGDDARFFATARANGVRIIDIRKPKPKEQQHFWIGRIKNVTTPRIAVLGTDCNLGKRTTTRFLTEACKKAGIYAEMIYTGQTGWMQGSKYGFIFDSTYNDFIAGELEHAIVSCFEDVHPDVMILEGQSDLFNPSGPCGSEFILSAGASAVILQHSPHRVYYHGCEKLELKIPPLEKFMQAIQFYGAHVLGLTLNAQGLNITEAREFKERYEQQYNIPVALPVEEGVDELMPAIKQYLSGQSHLYVH